MDIKRMMAEAQKLQNTFKKRMAEFEEQEFEINFKEYVKIKIKGNLEIISLNIDKDLIDPNDTEMLNDILIQAVNNAITEVINKKNELTSAISPGLNGLF